MAGFQAESRDHAAEMLGSWQVDNVDRYIFLRNNISSCLHHSQVIELIKFRLIVTD
jgi:hypothetical protein